MHLIEFVLRFGQHRHLSATLTLPPDGQAPRLGLLLLNVGIIHRIGPHRFNAKLARALAREGVATLRMDLSGQGDSGHPDESRPFEEQAVEDLQAAMDHFQRLCSLDRFVIAGLCSGAYSGFATALADPRVCALWMLDGYAYPTARTRWNRFTARWRTAPLHTLRSGVRKLIKRAARRIGNAGRRTAAQERPDFGHRAPTREAFARNVQALVDRGVALCFVYTGSMHRHFNYEEQLRDGFHDHGFVDHVKCEYLPQADHTATTLATQQRLIRSITDWLRDPLITASSASPPPSAPSPPSRPSRGNAAGGR